MGIKTRREYVVMAPTDVLAKISTLPDELKKIIFLYIPDRVPFQKELLVKQKQKEEKDIEFRKWVCETFNVTLTQYPDYFEFFDKYNSLVEGGVYDGEWKLFVFDDAPSKRIIGFIQELHWSVGLQRRVGYIFNNHNYHLHKMVALGQCKKYLFSNLSEKYLECD